MYIQDSTKLLDNWIEDMSSRDDNIHCAQCGAKITAHCETLSEPPFEIPVCDSCVYDPK